MRRISIENLIDFQDKKAEAQKILRQAEQDYWLRFCLNIDRYTRESKIWSCIRRMNGLSTQKKKVPNLIIEDKEVRDDKEKANSFAEYFSVIENDTHEIETQSTFNDQYFEEVSRPLVINEPFNMEELENALRIGNKKKSAPGHDNITYEVYYNLPPKGKEFLLKLYNRIWNTGNIPKVCKHSIFVPLIKSEKRSSQCAII